MPRIYKSLAGEKLVRERYLTFLKFWPTTNEQLRVPTREGETFVVASGDPTAPLLLFHGSAGNSAMWMGDVAAGSACSVVGRRDAGAFGSAGIFGRRLPRRMARARLCDSAARAD